MNSFHRWLTYAVAIATVGVLPCLAFAHNTGTSLNQVVGRYNVDIGYDPVGPVAGDRFVVDFKLTEDKTSKAIDFDYVWVRLVRDNVTLLATGIKKADIGPTTLLYQLPAEAAGTLNLEVRYNRGEDSIVEATFPIPIAPARSRGGLAVPLLSAAVGGAIGAGAIYAHSRLRRRSLET